MKTTLGKLKEFGACTSRCFRYEHLCEQILKTGREIKDDTKVSILEILNFNGVQDAFWALRTRRYKDYCLVLADIAESVLHIWEVKFPNDFKPRKTIQAIRAYKAGKINKKALISIANTIDLSTDKALWSIHHAACSLEYAIHTNVDPVDAAVYAAELAADAAEYTRAARAADAAVYAAAAADPSARKKQWNKNEEILRKHLIRKEKL